MNNSSSMENIIIVLMDQMLRENNDYISAKDIAVKAINENIPFNTDDEFKRANSFQKIKTAKQKIKKALKQYGLNLLEKDDPNDKRKLLFKYPEEVFKTNLDVIAEYRPQNRRFRLSQIDEILAHSKGLLPDKLISRLTMSRYTKTAQNNKFVQIENNEDLTNIILLPKLFLAIRDKKVLSFQYSPFNKRSRTVILHPYLLKEYNSRWYIIGYAEQTDGDFKLNNYAIDRIQADSLHTLNNIPYKKQDNIDINDYFKDIVGVSVPDANKITIKISTHSQYIHMLIKTKPFHRSQIERKTFDKRTGIGLFEIQVKPNAELRARILSFGHGISIESPREYRQQIKDEIKKMLDSYCKDDNYSSSSFPYSMESEVSPSLSVTSKTSPQSSH